MKERAKTAMSVIMSEEELNRIRFQDVAGGKTMEVIADVHGMKRFEAKRFLKNIIAVIRGAFLLLIIHGYNHGTAIRDMIRGSELGTTRIRNLTGVEWNKGQTVVTVGCA